MNHNNKLTMVVKIITKNLTMSLKKFIEKTEN